MRSRTRAATLLAVLLAAAWSAEAAPITNGDAVGTAYTIEGIDAGVAVDFEATPPGTANNNTIGKLTVTMSHANVSPLGFTLRETVAAAASSSATGGLRLLIDVIDFNGMFVDDWIDYHIHAEDNAEDVNAIQQLLNPGSQGSHKIEAHFHDSTAGFGSNPLVVQGSSDNVIDLNYGLGTAVAPTDPFTASNILLHERDFIGFAREFRVTFAPSIIPEPSTLLLVASGIAGLAASRRRRA